MSNPDWGMKRICPNCGTRYYDFQKSPPACPVCGTAYDPEALLKSRRSRTSVVEEPVKRKKAAVAAVDPDLPEIVGDDLEVAIVDEEVEVEDEELEEATGKDVADDTLLEEDADDLEDGIEEVDVEDPEEER